MNRHFTSNKNTLFLDILFPEKRRDIKQNKGLLLQCLSCMTPLHVILLCLYS